MKPQLIQANLIVKKSPLHGYGVFANSDINANTIIEECYGIDINETPDDLVNYAFRFEDKDILCTGFGSLYNHADTPNAGYVYDKENKIITIRAASNIKKSEEILIFYGKDWFDCRDMSAAKKSFRWRSPFWRFIRALMVCTILFLIFKFVMKQPDIIQILHDTFSQH